MTILPPLVSPGLTGTSLAALLETQHVPSAQLHMLRWLIWFPLLSVEGLTRLEQSRLAKQGGTCSPQLVALHIQKLHELGLVARLLLNEPGWPLRHYRYHLTDLGLSVFATLAQPPLSVPRLVQAYPVERLDLLKRLAQPQRLLATIAFATSLASGDDDAGITLTSYQQPWRQTDVALTRRQTLRCDAAFLLADVQGTEYAFYTRIDPDDRLPFEQKQERVLLERLLTLRHEMQLRREALPPFLIVTTRARLHRWGELLVSVSNKYGTALLDGAITTIEQMRQQGAYRHIWWPLTELTRFMHGTTPGELPPPSFPLSSLLRNPAGAALAERFSQRHTFAHLLTVRRRNLLHHTSKPFPTYVGKSLTNEVILLHAGTLADALCGTPSEQREALVLLNLALSAMQKELLFWLTHHPLLTAHHLAALHHPGARDIRGVQRQMEDLLRLGLLMPFHWNKAEQWQARERYLVTESGLRYMALREGKIATFYLLPDQYKKAGQSPALSVQLGTRGLFQQMPHTHGLYHCMIQLIERAHHESLRLIAWKNARESVETYRNPLTDRSMQIRPDATLILLELDKTVPSSVLIEYDRATTAVRDISSKYASYADYQEYTRLELPPILVITQNIHSARRIHLCNAKFASELCVYVILEKDLSTLNLKSTFQKRENG